MKIFTLNFILLLFSFLLQAQTESDKNGDAEEVKLIKMPKFPIADFPKKSVAISGIQILQLVPDSVRLGYVKKGIDNHVVQIIPAKPLGAMLNEQIERMYKNDYSHDGVALLFILKELRVGERSSFMEMAYTKFNAIAYVATGNKQFRQVTIIDTVFVRESGGDVTAWHGEDIQDAFKLLLKQTLINLKDAKAIIATPQSQEEIVAQHTQQPAMPILDAAFYNEGAYANFQEFLQNKPSITMYTPVKVDKRKVILVQVKDNNQPDTLKVWGVCKNGELYKYEEGFLIPLEKQGAGFIISNYVKLSSRRNNNSLGMMFGLLGVVADELIKSSNEKKQTEKLMFVKSIPYIKNVNKQPEASCIDMKTGELSF